MLIIKIFKEKTSIPETFRIEKFPCRIGRSKENDIVIESDWVSVNHCEIVNDGENFELRDLNSTNKIVHNKIILDKHQINDGDEVIVGDVKLTFYFDEEKYEKTKVNDLTVLSKSSLIQKYLSEHQIQTYFLYAIPLLLLILFYKMIFVYDFTYKTYARACVFVFWFFFCSYLLMVLISRLSNGHCFWRKLYREVMILFTITFAIIYLMEILEGIVINSDVLHFLGINLIGWNIVYRMGVVVYYQFKRKNTAIFSAIFVVCISLCHIGLYSILREDQHHDLRGTIFYPVINYSINNNKFEKIWLKMQASIDEVDKKRHELIKEKKEYFGR